MNFFYDYKGRKCHVVNEFEDLGYTMIVFRVWYKYKGYFRHEVEYKDHITRNLGKYYFKSRYSYLKDLNKQ